MKTEITVSSCATTMPATVLPRTRISSNHGVLTCRSFPGFLHFTRNGVGKPMMQYEINTARNSFRCLETNGRRQSRRPFTRRKRRRAYSLTSRVHPRRKRSEGKRPQRSISSAFGRTLRWRMWTWITSFPRWTCGSMLTPVERRRFSSWPDGSAGSPSRQDDHNRGQEP